MSRVFRKGEDPTTKVNLKLGPYGFEGESNGKVKLQAGVGFVETNVRQAVTGFGVEFSAKDLIQRHYEKMQKVVTDDIKNMPDVKVSVGLFFQGLTVGTVLAYTSGAPGFFERRLVAELLQVDWDSLDLDEQLHLEALKWNKENWDQKGELTIDRLPPSARTDFIDLPAEEKVAAVHLGLPARDPYWRGFWKKVAARSGVDDVGTSEQSI